MIRIALALLVVLTVAQRAEAYFVISSGTVGYWVAHSDCVVRGAYMGYELVELPNPAGKGTIRWKRMTINVRETLRGPNAKTLSVYIRADDWFRWSDLSSDSLFFLRAGANVSGRREGETESPFKNIDWTIDWINQDAPSEFILDPNADERPGPWYADDLRPLQTREDVLQEVRRVGAQGSIGTTTIHLPADVQEGLKTSAYSYLAVGLSQEIFAVAREWVTAADPKMRWCGAEVLVEKGSPENAAALLAFVRGPFVETYPRGCEARARILMALRTWGVADLPALVVSSRPFFDVAKRSAWLSLAGAVLLPGVYAGWMRRRARVLTFLWLGVLSAVVMLAIRSYWPRDAATWGDFDLAAENGRLYLAQQGRASAGLPSPPVFCSPEELLKYQNVERLLLFPPTGLGWEWNYTEFREALPKSFAERMNPSHGAMGLTARLQGPVWQVPMWVIVGLLAAPAVVVGWRRRRRGRMRGFPVEIAA